MNNSDIFESSKVEGLNTQVFLIDTLKDFLKWWYIKIPVQLILRLRRILTIIDDSFSISQLILTFFVPWHRDYSFVGYFIGIMARIIILIPGLITFILTFIIYLLIIIAWLLIPIVCITLTVISPFNV
ncbi:MAG TPA: hypothetical protein VHA74_03095 [Candidatus Dojkabacteria bacterium]|nr:hypothetical protein [Candidatus Dojkabacteria bacterium]